MVITDASQRYAAEPSELRAKAVSARYLFAGVATVAAVVALCAGLLLAYGYAHNDTVYRGVSVDGVSLAGLTHAEASAEIRDVAAERLPKQITFASGSNNVTARSSDLKMQVDTAATTEQVYSFGRTGDLWHDSRAWISSLLNGRDYGLITTTDQLAVRKTLQTIAPNVVTAPVNARYAMTPSGKLSVVNGVNGTSIDVAATTTEMQKQVSQLDAGPVEIATVSVAPSITAKSLEAKLDKAKSMLSEPLLLSSGSQSWKLTPQQLHGLLTLVPNDAGDVSLGLQRSALTATIASLSTPVNQPGENPIIAWSGKAFWVKPASKSVSLDVDATVNAVESALSSGKHQVALVTQQEPTAISDESARQSAEQAAALIKQPLEVDWPGGKAQILPGNLASLMRFSPDPQHPDRFAISLDQAGLKSLLTSMAPQIETPAKNADLRYLDGKVVVKSPEKAGTQLAIGPSVNAVNMAVLAGKSSATLTTEPVQPTVTAAMAGSISLPDVLATSKTYYGGAAANRAFNVELAVQRVNGAMVPPGGTFSFDGSVGAIDTEHGYKLGYGIVGTTDGSVSTVPSVGGGVCQVSTTVFQSAFWAGLPIVQRSWHMYWIPAYGQPPSGLTGLDATVDTDVGLDLKFKNTTGHWLAVSGYADGTSVNFEILGTNPGWDVQVSQPVVTNVVQPPDGMEYEKSDALPSGQSLLVQAAQQGFDVDVHRVVTQDGKVLDDLHLKSEYLPAGNITLQGTGS